MQTASLEELFTKADKQAPYGRSISVKVISVGEEKSYTNDRLEERKYKKAGVADGTRAVKLLLYDPLKFMKLKEGNNLILRNFIAKPEGSIVATSTTKIFQANEDVNVPQNLRDTAQQLITPTAAEVQPLAKALSSPLKQKVSVTAQIIQEEVTHSVTVRNQPVSVKHVYVKNKSTPRCRISLWRDCAENKFKTGDYVTITNLVVNNYKNEISLSTTSQPTIQKTDAPEETTIHIVQAVTYDELEHLTFLDVEDETINIPITLIKQIHPEVTPEEYENFFQQQIAKNMRMKIISKGSDILSFSYGEN